MQMVEANPFSKLKIQRLLGKGVFGYVFQVVLRKENKLFALKR